MGETDIYVESDDSLLLDTIDACTQQTSTSQVMWLVVNVLTNFLFISFLSSSPMKAVSSDT